MGRPPSRREPGLGTSPDRFDRALGPVDLVFALGFLALGGVGRGCGAARIGAVSPAPGYEVLWTTTALGMLAGLRREGSYNDVYELAQKIVRLGLTPSARPPKRGRKRGADRKRK